MLRANRHIVRALASHTRMSVRGLAFGDSFRDRSSGDYMEQPPSNYGFAIGKNYEFDLFVVDENLPELAVHQH